MIDSNIIDCIPQTGPCPLNCSECYYNGGRFYRTLDSPLIPTLEEAKGKIVRVNSGHDSNLLTNEQLKLTSLYSDRYYNTSLPKLLFNAPTILTINGRDTDKTFYIAYSDILGELDSLMSVRFRVNTWNLDLAEKAIRLWQDITPIILTDMRYYGADNGVPPPSVKNPEDYVFGKHILNSYWKLNDCGKAKVMELLSYHNVFWEGNPFYGSTLCKDCRLCEHFYFIAKERLKHHGKLK
jgi:hypothetical protein